MAAGLLKRGSRGAEVRSLQVQLNTVLNANPKLTTDGVFGGQTQAAVKSFQSKARISADGIVGPQTRQKLSEAAKRKSSSSTDVLRVGSRGADVKKLQRLLNLKSPKGPKLVADGAFGPKTARAVTNFQIHAGINADGIVGAQTWAALESAPDAPRKALDPPRNTLPPSGAPDSDAPSTERPYYSGIVEAYGDPEDWSYFKRVNLPFTLQLRRPAGAFDSGPQEGGSIPGDGIQSSAESLWIGTNREFKNQSQLWRVGEQAKNARWYSVVDAYVGSCHRFESFGEPVKVGCRSGNVCQTRLQTFAGYF